MKTFFLIIVGIFVIGLTYLFFKGREMQVISTEIEIIASPEKVWSIITDVDKWEDWNPIINKSSGNVSLDSKLDITMKGKAEGEDGPRYAPIIIKLEQPKYFMWRAHMLAGFIFTNDKILELEKTANGTRLIHKETFKGLLAPIFCGQMEKGVTPMLNAMNKALKELAER